MKKALITGITGQDGSYLAELLLEKGYEVHGLVRRASTSNTTNIDGIINHLKLYLGDITDSFNVSSIIQAIQPDEIYNLAAQSHVKVSFNCPYYTGQVNAIGALNILEGSRMYCPTTKVYQASTSELFGVVSEIPQTETTPFYPRSPYGISKLYAYWATVNYRESYNLFACNGILYNHESERRGDTFVTKKIINEFVKIKNNQQSVLRVGNLDAKRDWGYAKEYVEGMWRILQNDKPDDFILATGESHTVREFIELTALHLEYDLCWEGEGLEEKGYDRKTRQLLVVVDKEFFRPSEVAYLLGNPIKAKTVLGWEAKTKFSDLVKIMIENSNYGD